MKIGIVAIALAAIVIAGLWMFGIIGGGTVYGTSWLNGRTNDSPSGDQVVITIGEGGVPAGLAPETEVLIGALDTGKAYCRATIVEALETPDGPGYATKCFEAP